MRRLKACTCWPVRLSCTQSLYVQRRFGALVMHTPQLTPGFAWSFQVRLGAVNSLLGLLSHDNTDIAVDVIKLLADLTDPDAVAEHEDDTVLVNALVLAPCCMMHG